MKLATLFTLFLLLASPAFAKDVTFHACTTDHNDNVLVVDVNENASKDVLVNIDSAFVTAAKDLDSDQLGSGVGFRAFVTHLSKEAVDAINDVQPPKVVGECK